MTGSILASGVMASLVPRSTKATSLLPVDGDRTLAIPRALALLRVTYPNGALLARGCRERNNGTIFLLEVNNSTKEDVAIALIRGLSPP